VITLSSADPKRLVDAVYAVAIQGSRGSWLQRGAEEARDEEPGEANLRFQTLLEIGYLVASADGFAQEERAMLARLLERLTGSVLSSDVFDLHFRDLEAAVVLLGRWERVARAAADLDRDHVDEVIRLATLIAMADGRLTEAELDVLVQVGTYTGVAVERIRELVDRTATHVEETLR